MKKRHSIPLPDRVTAEGKMVSQIAAERGVQPFEVMFNMHPKPRENAAAATRHPQVGSGRQ